MLTVRVWRDARTLVHLVRPSRRHAAHADRLEDFYRGQADDYDGFRERLLPGRRELVQSLPLRPGATWIDLGGGTARNLDHAGPALTALAAVHVVDLTPSLLSIAERRCRTRGWSNVHLINGDATATGLPSGVADVVTCSYALTMIPDWRAAIEEARRLLKPGGTFGAVDFYVAPAHPPMTRRVWPWWFRHSHVMLNPDHLPYLQQRFMTTTLAERRTPLPYVPVGQVPYYRFTGLRP